jgi:phage/plasmid-associated DNA primase
MVGGLPLRHRWDPISARFMRQDFFTFSPAIKLWIGGNHKPGLRGVDEAIRRRLNLIPFIGWCQSRPNP